MNRFCLCFLLICSFAPSRALTKNAVQRVTIVQDAKGAKLQVDGRDFMIFGMNWGYMPIGQNHSYRFWAKPDWFIKEALHNELSLLKRMGINAIRQTADIPPRWVTYIYQHYGIFTAINHTVGRYGYVVDGVWQSPINYQDPQTRKTLKADLVKVVKRYKNVPGVLLWMLGNENNYGLQWSSYEIEKLPSGEQQSAKARYLYSLYGEIIDLIKRHDKNHPVSIANGDLQYIDLVKKHCKQLDLFASNVYRGISARDLFQVVKHKLNVPVFFSEFGADAYNAKTNQEDHLAQAHYLRGQWQEIYEQSYNKGRVGNAIGGFVFQWSDGWWKYKQDVDLELHNTEASWPTDAYPHDFQEGRNNMNEEWFGICAKHPNDERGLYSVTPRTAYYVLKKAFQLDPYAKGTSLKSIRTHFASLDLDQAAIGYVAQNVSERLGILEKLSLANLRLNLEGISSGGLFENEQGRTNKGVHFNHMESVYLDFAFKPFRNLQGGVSVNLLGNVPETRMNEIYYENRGRPKEIIDTEGERVVLKDLERIKLYQAHFDWNSDYFDLSGYYRSGHYHWGYEGDFFGLYREANYQQAVDRYNATAPYGVVFSGKQLLDGLKVAFGPELYWGANPSVVLKYYRELGGFSFSVMHAEDITQREVSSMASAAIPEPVSRKSTLYLAYKAGLFSLEVGGIWSGSTKIDQSILLAHATDGASFQDSGYEILEDKVAWLDTLGAKVKLSFETAWLQWYAQAAYKGLVADGGPDGTTTFVGWSLKESGRGNHYSLLSGASIKFGPFRIAPNFLYQKPIEGPLPRLKSTYNPITGKYYSAIWPRNVQDNAFAVLDNRETIGFELLMVFDPTPGTWFWMWDNDVREDAAFAASLNLSYRIQPTRRDATLAFLEDGTIFAFNDAPEAKDVWDINARIISHPRSDLRIIAHAYAGQGQGKSPDSRLITRYGADARVIWDKFVLQTQVKINDWGPYDYHRDFDLTFPVQVLADLSVGLSAPKFIDPNTRFGILYQFRSLDENSPRYHLQSDHPNYGRDWGSEYELVTYVRISL